MCTGFVYRDAKDTYFGYNLDIDPSVWDFRIVKNSKYFGVAIRFQGKTVYTHGVNFLGRYACLPYMNDDDPPKSPPRAKRIDRLVDDFLRLKIDQDALRSLLSSVPISHMPGTSFHALIGDTHEEGYLVEPGFPPQTISSFQVVANFPLLKPVSDDKPYYGKERYDRLSRRLSSLPGETSPLELLSFLKEVAQTGTWATRISFVYSSSRQCVYYQIPGEEGIRTHHF